MYAHTLSSDILFKIADDKNVEQIRMEVGRLVYDNKDNVDT